MLSQSTIIDISHDVIGNDHIILQSFSTTESCGILSTIVVSDPPLHNPLSTKEYSTTTMHTFLIQQNSFLLPVLQDLILEFWLNSWMKCLTNISWFFKQILGSRRLYKEQYCYCLYCSCISGLLQVLSITIGGSIKGYYHSTGWCAVPGLFTLALFWSVAGNSSFSCCSFYWHPVSLGWRISNRERILDIRWYYSLQ